MRLANCRIEVGIVGIVLANVAFGFFQSSAESNHHQSGRTWQGELSDENRDNT